MCIYIKEDIDKQTFICEGTKGCWLWHGMVTWL